MNLYIGQLRGEMLWLKMIICIAFLAHTICIMCDLVDVYGDAMTSWILVNTGFGDGLLPGGTNIESLSTEPSITVFDYIWPNMTIFIQAYIYIYIYINSPPCGIYASANRVSIGSDNGLSPIRRQAIIWTSAELLLIGHLGTNLMKT